MELKARIIAVRYNQSQIVKGEPIKVNMKNGGNTLKEDDLDFPNQPQFISVGISGKTEQTLKNGKCSFSGLKFTSTSYNNERSFFFLVAIVYKDSPKQEEEKIELSETSD